MVHPGAKHEKGAVTEGYVYTGDNVIFGSNCVVKGDIQIGENTVIGSMVLIEGTEIIIGKNSKIMPFAAIGSKTIIGDNCFIGPYFCMANAKHPGEGAILEHLTIGNNVMIGTGCKVWPGITIGDDVKINMCLTIHKDVPSGTHIRSDWW